MEWKLDLSHDAYFANKAGSYLETTKKSVFSNSGLDISNSLISHLPSNGKQEFDAF